MIVVRYADDFLVGFQFKTDAMQYFTELKERFAKFQLTLHPEKTRLLEFGRFAVENRKRRGQRKPETFNFLGFTHSCGKTRGGKFTVFRRTMKKRLQAKLNEVKIELRLRMHDPVQDVGQWLRAVVRGHYQYYGIPMNSAALSTFYYQVNQHWWKMLGRRSQKGRLTWERMRKLIRRWIPLPRICHPYPLRRFGVCT